MKQHFTFLLYFVFGTEWCLEQFYYKTYKNVNAKDIFDAKFSLLMDTIL